MTREQLAARITRWLEKMEADVRQMVRDKEWWNAHRTDATPFDVGADKVFLKLLAEEKAAWFAQLANDTIMTRAAHQECSRRTMAHVRAIEAADMGDIEP